MDRLSRRIDDREALGALRVAMSGLAQRQRAIAHNIANVDTPGFKATSVRFEDQLASALARRGSLPLSRTNAGHLRLASASVSDVRPTEEIVQSLTYRNDGNNVDVDAQMSELAETQLRFSAATQAISGRMATLRTIISDGRR